MRAQPLSKHPVHRRWPRSTAESRKRSRRGGNRWCSLRPPPSPPNSANSGSPGGSAWLRSKRAHRGGEGGGRRVLASSIVKRERGERASSLSLSLCRAWREVNVLRPLRGRTLFNNALLRTLTRYNGDSGEGCRRVCVCARIHERGQAAYLCIPFSVVTREEGWPPFLSPPPPHPLLFISVVAGRALEDVSQRGRKGDGWVEGGRKEGRKGRNSLNVSFDN